MAPPTTPSPTGLGQEPAEDLAPLQTTTGHPASCSGHLTAAERVGGRGGGRWGRAAPALSKISTIKSYSFTPKTGSHFPTASSYYRPLNFFLKSTPQVNNVIQFAKHPLCFVFQKQPRLSWGVVCTHTHLCVLCACAAHSKGGPLAQEPHGLPAAGEALCWRSLALRPRTRSLSFCCAFFSCAWRSHEDG